MHGVDVDQSLLKGLECVFTLGVEEEIQRLEIAGSAEAQVVAPPPVATALELQGDSLAHGTEAVGTGDDGEGEVDLVEVHALEGVFREDVEAAGAAEVLPVHLPGGEDDRVFILHDRRLKTFEGDFMGTGRVAWIENGVVGPADILGGDGASVAPQGARVKHEGEGFLVV